MTKKNKKETVKFRRVGSAFFKRAVALFLSIAQVLIGSPAYPSEIPKSVRLNLPGIQVEFKIPERLGNLEEFHNAPCAEPTETALAPADGRRPGTVPASFRDCPLKTVIYIQDAHDSLEAQENIAKLIHLLIAKYGVKTVLEEGYEGPVPTDKYFGKIKDPKVRRKVAYFLMDKLRLGGAEYAHITRFNSVGSRRSSVVSLKNKKKSAGELIKQSEKNSFYSRLKTDDSQRDFQLIGADSLLLHRKNIERYQASEKHRAETQADLQTMDAEIRKMTQQYFSRELKEWMGIKEKLDRKELDLLDYLKRTQTLLSKGIGFEEFHTLYPNISLLLSAAETKDEKILIKLKTSLNYKTLFLEINKLEDDYADSHLAAHQGTGNLPLLARHPLGGPVPFVQRDREIFRYYKLIQLLKRLNAIEVTEEEYDAVKETLHATNTAQIAEFIARESGQSVVLSKLWEKNIQSAIDFYEIAQERDGSIQSRLKDYAASDDSAPVILIYGGFHKGRVKELLEQNGFSYAVVSPRITSASPKHESYYRQLMRMGYNSMALPKLVATATTPPRFLNFAAVSGKSEVRMQALLKQLTQIAGNEKLNNLTAAVGEMDLVFARSEASPLTSRRLSLVARTVRSEVRSNLLGSEDSNPQSTRRAVLERQQKIILAKALLGKEQQQEVTILVKRYDYESFNLGVLGGAYFIAQGLLEAVPGLKVKIIYLGETAPRTDMPVFSKYFEKYGDRVELIQAEWPLADRPAQPGLKIYVDGVNQAYPFDDMTEHFLHPQDRIILAGGFLHKALTDVRSVDPRIVEVHSDFRLAQGTLPLDASRLAAVKEKDGWSLETLLAKRRLWYDSLEHDMGSGFGALQHQSLMKLAVANDWSVEKAITTWAYVQSPEVLMTEMSYLGAALQTSPEKIPFIENGRQIVLHLLGSKNLERDEKWINFLERLHREQGFSYVTPAGEFKKGSLPITVVYHSHMANDKLRQLQILSGTLTRSSSAPDSPWLEFPAYVTGYASLLEALSLGIPWVHDKNDVKEGRAKMALSALVKHVFNGLDQTDTEGVPFEENYQAWNGIEAEVRMGEFYYPGVGTVRKMARYTQLKEWNEWARFFSSAMFKMNMVDDAVIELADMVAAGHRHTNFLSTLPSEMKASSKEALALVEELRLNTKQSFAMRVLLRLAMQLDLYGQLGMSLSKRAKQDPELISFQDDLRALFTLYGQEDPQTSNHRLDRILEKMWRTDAFYVWQKTGREHSPDFGAVYSLLRERLKIQGSSETARSEVRTTPDESGALGTGTGELSRRSEVRNPIVIAVEDFKREVARAKNTQKKLELLISHLLINDEYVAFNSSGERRRMLNDRKTDIFWAIGWESRLTLFGMFDQARDRKRMVRQAMKIAGVMDREKKISQSYNYTAAVNDIVNAYWAEWHRQMSLGELRLVAKFGRVFNRAGYTTFSDLGLYPANKQTRVRSAFSSTGRDTTVFLVFRVPSFRYENGGVGIGLPRVGNETLPEGYKHKPTRLVDESGELGELGAEYIDIEVSLEINEILRRVDGSNARQYREIKSLLNRLKRINSGARRAQGGEAARSEIRTKDDRAERKAVSGQARDNLSLSQNDRGATDWPGRVAIFSALMALVGSVFQPGMTPVSALLLAGATAIGVFTLLWRIEVKQRHLHSKWGYEPTQKQQAMLKRLNLEWDSQKQKLKRGSNFKALRLKSRLIYVRHGDTKMIDKTHLDGKSRFQGSRDDEDNDLSDTGRAQAEAAVDKIRNLLRKGESFRLFRSPRKRTAQTAAPSEKAFDKMAVERKGLQEIRFGAVSNLTEEEIAERLGSAAVDEAAAYRDHNAVVRFPGGESFVDVLDRARDELLALDQALDGETGVLFAHGTLGAAFEILLGYPEFFDHAGYVTWRKQMPETAQPFVLSEPAQRMVSAGDAWTEMGKVLGPQVAEQLLIFFEQQLGGEKISPENMVSFRKLSSRPVLFNRQRSDMGGSTSYEEHVDRFEMGVIGYPDKILFSSVKYDGKTLAFCESWLKERTDIQNKVASSGHAVPAVIIGGKRFQMDVRARALATLPLSEPLLAAVSEALGEVYQKTGVFQIAVMSSQDSRWEMPNFRENGVFVEGHEGAYKIYFTNFERAQQKETLAIDLGGASRKFANDFHTPLMQVYRLRPWGDPEIHSLSRKIRKAYHSPLDEMMRQRGSHSFGGLIHTLEELWPLLLKGRDEFMAAELSDAGEIEKSQVGFILNRLPGQMLGFKFGKTALGGDALQGLSDKLYAEALIDGFLPRDLHANHPAVLLLSALNADLTNHAAPFKKSDVERMLRESIDHYFRYLLELASLRIWDEGNPDENYERLQSLLDTLTPVIKTPAGLLLTGMSRFGFQDAYPALLDKVEKLNPSRQRDFYRLYSQHLMGHLSSAIRFWVGYESALQRLPRSGFGALDYEAMFYDLDTTWMRPHREGNDIDYLILLRALIFFMKQIPVEGNYAELSSEQKNLIQDAALILQIDEEAFTGARRSEILRDTLLHIHGGEKLAAEFEELLVRHQPQLAEFAEVHLDADNLIMRRHHNFAVYLADLMALENMTTPEFKALGLEDYLDTRTVLGEPERMMRWGRQLMDRDQTLLHYPQWTSGNLVDKTDSLNVKRDPQPFRLERLRYNLSRLRSEVREINIAQRLALSDQGEARAIRQKIASFPGLAAGFEYGQTFFEALKVVFRRDFGQDLLNKRAELKKFSPQIQHQGLQAFQTLYRLLYGTQTLSENPELTSQVFQNYREFAVVGVAGIGIVIFDHGHTLAGVMGTVNLFFAILNFVNSQYSSRSEVRTTLVGEVGRRYEIQGYVAGMTTLSYVKRGLEVTSGTSVAIKIMEIPDGFDTWEFLQGHKEIYEREVRILKRLTHENFPYAALLKDAAVDVAEAKKVQWLATEWVDGVRLSHWAFGKPLEEIISKYEEILTAYEQLHALKIIHADVKPNNILISKEGSVKLVDFGMSQMDGIGPSILKWDHDYPYAVPEMYQQGSVLTPESDVFALGVVLFELATGKSMWTEDDIAGKLPFAARQSAQPLTIEKIQTKLSADWAPYAGVIAKAIALNPNDRYESAEAMRLALAQIRQASFPTLTEGQLTAKAAGLSEADLRRSGFFILNKPKGYVTAEKGDSHVPGKRIALGLLPPQIQSDARHFVGRLDEETTGLLLYGGATLLHSLLLNSHLNPNHKIEKTYEAIVWGHVTEADLAKLRAGVTIRVPRGNAGKKGDYLAVPEGVEIEERFYEGTTPLTRVRMILSEGKNRQVRRMWKTVNHTVRDLRRISFGEIHLGDLSLGQSRELTAGEYHWLESVAKERVLSAAVPKPQIESGTRRPARAEVRTAFRLPPIQRFGGQLGLENLRGYGVESRLTRMGSELHLSDAMRLFIHRLRAVGNDTEQMLDYLVSYDEPNPFQIRLRKVVAQISGLSEKQIIFASRTKPELWAFSGQPPEEKKAPISFVLGDTQDRMERVLLIPNDIASPFRNIVVLMHELAHAQQSLNAVRRLYSSLAMAITEGFQRYRERELISEGIRANQEFATLVTEAANEAWTIEGRGDKPEKLEDLLEQIFNWPSMGSYAAERRLVDALITQSGEQAVRDFHQSGKYKALRDGLGHNRFDTLALFFMEWGRGQELNPDMGGGRISRELEVELALRFILKPEGKTYPRGWSERLQTMTQEFRRALLRALGSNGTFHRAAEGADVPWMVKALNPMITAYLMGVIDIQKLRQELDIFFHKLNRLPFRSHVDSFSEAVRLEASRVPLSERDRLWRERGKPYTVALTRLAEHHWQAVQQNGSSLAFELRAATLPLVQDHLEPFRALLEVEWPGAKKTIGSIVEEILKRQGDGVVLLFDQQKVIGFYQYDKVNNNLAMFGVNADYRQTGAYDVLLEDLVSRYFNNDRRFKFRGYLQDFRSFWGTVEEFKRERWINGKVSWNTTVLPAQRSEVRTNAGASGNVTPDMQPNLSGSWVLLLSSSGEQTPGMGKRLYEQNGLYRDILDRAGKILGIPLAENIFSGRTETSNDPRIFLPALVVTNYALYKVLEQEAGAPLNVGAIYGLSVGQVAAHMIAGSFSFEDGIRLAGILGEAVYEITQKNPGEMALVWRLEGRSAETIAAEHGVSVGIRYALGENSMEYNVLSGARENMERAKEAVLEAGGKVGRIETGGMAAHSPLLSPMVPRIRRFLDEKISIEDPQIPILSNISGRYLSRDEIKEDLLSILNQTVGIEPARATLQTGHARRFLALGTKEKTPFLFNFFSKDAEKLYVGASQSLSMDNIREIIRANALRSEMRNSFSRDAHGKLAVSPDMLRQYPWLSEHLAVWQRLERDGIRYHEDAYDLIHPIETQDRPWAMRDFREEDLTSPLVRAETLKTNALELVFSHAVRIGDGDSGGNNRGVYLAYVKGIEHPVIVKKLQPNTQGNFRKNWNRLEIYAAQLADFSGVGPKFYGVTVNPWTQGIDAYVTQATGGHQDGAYPRGLQASIDGVDELLFYPQVAKVFRQKMQEIQTRLGRYGIDLKFLNYLYRDDGTVSVIDAGDLVLNEVFGRKDEIPDDVLFKLVQDKIMRRRSLVSGQDEQSTRSEVRGGKISGGSVGGFENSQLSERRKQEPQLWPLQLEPFHTWFSSSLEGQINHPMIKKVISRIQQAIRVFKANPSVNNLLANAPAKDRLYEFISVEARSFLFGTVNMFFIGAYITRYFINNQLKNDIYAISQGAISRSEVRTIKSGVSGTGIVTTIPEPHSDELWQEANDILWPLVPELRAIGLNHDEIDGMVSSIYRSLDINYRKIVESKAASPSTEALKPIAFFGESSEPSDELLLQQQLLAKEFKRMIAGKIAKGEKDFTIVFFGLGYSEAVPSSRKLESEEFIALFYEVLQKEFVSEKAADWSLNFFALDKEPGVVSEAERRLEALKERMVADGIPDEKLSITVRTALLDNPIQFKRWVDKEMKGKADMVSQRHVTYVNDNIHNIIQNVVLAGNPEGDYYNLLAFIEKYLMFRNMMSIVKRDGSLIFEPRKNLGNPVSSFQGYFHSPGIEVVNLFDLMPDFSKESVIGREDLGAKYTGIYRVMDPAILTELEGRNVALREVLSAIKATAQEAGSESGLRSEVRTNLEVPGTSRTGATDSSEVRSGEKLKREKLQEWIKQKAIFPTETVYYPGIGDDFEDSAKKTGAKTIIGVDPAFERYQEQLKVKFASQEITAIPQTVVIQTPAGEKKVNRFEFQALIDSRQVQFILYAGDANLLTPDLLPETQEGYDMFYSQGWGFDSDMYRKAVSSLRAAGLFIVHVVPAFLERHSYDSLAAMENDGVLKEGTALSIDGLDRVFVGWEKVEPLTIIRPAHRLDTMIDAFLYDPLWGESEGYVDEIVGVFLNATDRNIQRMIFEKISRLSEESPEMLAAVLQTMERSPDPMKVYLLSAVTRSLVSALTPERKRRGAQDYRSKINSARHHFRTLPYLYTGTEENMTETLDLLSRSEMRNSLSEEDGARHQVGGQLDDVRSEVRIGNTQGEVSKWQSSLWDFNEIKQVLHEYARNEIIDWLRLEASLVKLEGSQKMELSQWIEREETIFKDLPSGTWPQLLRNRFYDFRIRGILNSDKRITGWGEDYFRYFPVGELWQGLFSRFSDPEFREKFLRFKVQIQSTSNKERQFLDRMKWIDGLQGHGFANSYISGHAAAGDYPYYNHPHELRDHWAMLNVMLEGFQKGDFGLFDAGGHRARHLNSVWQEEDNENPIHPATYGPYYGVPERTGTFKNILNKENMVFVVPGDDDVQFLKAGLEEAVRLGKINLEMAQDQLRRVMTRDQALELPWDKFLQVFEFQQEWNNGLRIEPGDSHPKSEVRSATVAQKGQSLEEAGQNFLVSSRSRDFENPVSAGTVPRLLVPTSLRSLLEKAGPTKVFVDAAAPVESPEQTAGELARLAKVGVEVVVYNLKSARSENRLMKILETFPKAVFHSVMGSWNDALAGSEHARDEMNLVHYSESEAEAKRQAPAWAEKRVIYLAGKAGSATYGLSQIKVLRKAVEAEEIKESLLAKLEIIDKNGFYFVSESKSAWMRLQLAAESIVAFARAA